MIEEVNPRSPRNANPKRGRGKARSLPVRAAWLSRLLDLVQALALPGDETSSHQSEKILARFMLDQPPQKPLERLILRCLALELTVITLPAWARLTIDSRVQRLLPQFRSHNDDPIRSTTQCALAHKVKGIIDREFAEHLTIKFLARRLGVHRNRVGRAFHREFGTSVNEYVAISRIAAATELIGGSVDKIETIASAVGFKSRAAFSIWCVQLMGCSPGVLRSRLQVQQRTHKCIQEHELA